MAARCDFPLSVSIAGCRDAPRFRKCRGRGGGKGEEEERGGGRERERVTEEGGSGQVRSGQVRYRLSGALDLDMVMQIVHAFHDTGHA